MLSVAVIVLLGMGSLILRFLGVGVLCFLPVSSVFRRRPHRGPLHRLRYRLQILPRFLAVPLQTNANQLIETTDNQLVHGHRRCDRPDQHPLHAENLTGHSARDRKSVV